MATLTLMHHADDVATHLARNFFEFLDLRHNGRLVVSGKLKTKMQCVPYEIKKKKAIYGQSAFFIVCTISNGTIKFGKRITLQPQPVRNQL